MKARADAAGIGMTSQRTRARMVRAAARARHRATSACWRRWRRCRGTCSSRRRSPAAPTRTPRCRSASAQTISQPYVVARMIEIAAAKTEAEQRCSRSAPAAATRRRCWRSVFAEVYSVERIKALHERARQPARPAPRQPAPRVHGDGDAGLAKAAPFDAIVVAAAARAMPEALLRPARAGRQHDPAAAHAGAGTRSGWCSIERSGRGFVESELDAVHFVPLEAGKGVKLRSLVLLVLLCARAAASARGLLPSGDREQPRARRPAPPRRQPRPAAARRGHLRREAGRHALQHRARARRRLPRGRALEQPRAIRPRSASARCCASTPP